MRLSSSLLHHHHIMSKRVPAVLFPFSLPTSVQRQTLSPRLLQFRPSSSSGSDDVEFQNKVHQLIAAQRAVDRAQSKGGFTMREIIERATTLTLEENSAIMKQFLDAERGRLRIILGMLNEEADRLDPSDPPKAQRLAGPKKMTKVVLLISDRAAEPSYGLTPHDLEMVKKAVSEVASNLEKGATHLKVSGFALGAGILYYVYTTLNWLP